MKGKALSFGNFFAASLALVVITGCGNRGGGSVAVINGEQISKEDFYGFLERKRLVQVQTPTGPQEAPIVGTLGLQALRDIVNRRVLLQLAEKEGMLPTNADIDKELAFQTKRRPDFVSFLTDQGMSLQMIREDIKYDLARERLLTKGVDLPMSDVDTYVRENPEMFMEPAQAQLLYVVVTDEEKKSLVDKDLGTGQNFQVVANRYSEAPRARELGGMYPESKINSMPKRLQQIVSTTPELRSTEWLRDGKNWVKFYVQKKTEAKPIVMDDVKKEYVRRQLAMKKGEKSSQLAKRLNDTLRTSKIDVMAAHLKGPWDKAFERAKTELARETGSETVAAK